MIFDFNQEKNIILKRERNITFGEVIKEIILWENLLDILPHPNVKKYPNQKIYIINLKDYVYYIPFVESNKTIFLKNIIPSRKYKKIYNI